MKKFDLLNFKANDNIRNFYAFPFHIDWYKINDRLNSISDIEVNDFITDGIIEAWIDFTYKNHKFSINNQFSEYWLFDNSGECEEEILQEHLNKIERDFSFIF